EHNTDDPTLSGNRVSFGGTLSSQNYFDLAGIWEINEQYALRLGVNNILDEDPPLVDTLWSGPGTPNTWGPYDTLGMQVFLAVNAKFCPFTRLIVIRGRLPDGGRPLFLGCGSR